MISRAYVRCPYLLSLLAYVDDGTGYLHSPVKCSLCFNLYQLFITLPPYTVTYTDTMAISFAGWITHWIIYFRFFLQNHASVKQFQNYLIKNYDSENSPEVLPSNITSNSKLSINREVLQAAQKWEVFYVKPKTGQERKKVVVYWHGGAFFKRVSLFHRWQRRNTADIIGFSETLGCSRSNGHRI